MARRPRSQSARVQSGSRTRLVRACSGSTQDERDHADDQRRERPRRDRRRSRFGLGREHPRRNRLPNQPKDRDRVGLVPVGEGPRDVAVASGAIWVANEFSGTISRIDPGTNSVSPRPRSAAGQPGWRSWAARSGRPPGPRAGAPRGNVHLRLSLRPDDYLDPANSYSSETLQILSLTADGLTAFRRVGGSEEHRSFLTWRPSCRRQPTAARPTRSSFARHPLLDRRPCRAERHPGRT